MEPHRIAYVGDIGSDVEAAEAAGPASVLVPTSVTRPAEIRAAPVVRRTLTERWTTCWTRWAIGRCAREAGPGRPTRRCR